MPRLRLLHLFLAFFLFTLAGPASASAQIPNVKKAAERGVNKVIDKKERDVENKVTGAASCALMDSVCIEDAKKDGKDVQITDSDGNPVTDDDGNPITDLAEAEKKAISRDYDFARGAKIVRVIDFESEPTGRFPAAQIEYLRGTMQVVEMEDESKALEVSDDGRFRVILPEALPEDYTVEFKLRIGAPNSITRVLMTPLESASYSRFPHHYLQFYQSVGIYKSGSDLSGLGGFRRMTEEFLPVEFTHDGQTAILYVDTERGGMIPVADFGSSAAIEFRMSGNTRFRSYIKEIVIAYGVESLYDGLMESGEVTTYGIPFDTDEDVPRAEAKPTLSDILEMMEAHPDLRIEIGGHTDSQGGDEYNMDLSERRANSVRTYLTSNGISDDRVTAVGYGEGKPIADNETPEGRAQNRRVTISVLQ